MEKHRQVSVKGVHGNNIPVASWLDGGWRAGTVIFGAKGEVIPDLSAREASFSAGILSKLGFCRHSEQARWYQRRC